MRCLLIILTLVGMTTLQAGDAELFGYYESQYMGSEIGETYYQVYSNKLRIDLSGGLSERITFAANFDYITYNGKTVWNILDLLDATIAAQVPAGAEGFFVFPFQDRNFLDNAYLKLAFDRFDLTVGKQQLALGTGYAWNPLDVFNVKDLLDPSYEQPGHNAVRIDFPISRSFNLTVLVSPEDTWDNSDKMVELKGRLGRFDFSVNAIEKLWSYTDFMTLDPVIGFPATAERRRLAGFSTAGELLGLGLWAEYGYNDLSVSEDFYELAAGIDYTLDWGTYLMAEYFCYSAGKTAVTDYTLNDWMRVYANEQKALSRDQLYLFAMHPLTDLTVASLSTIINISDGSTALVPALEYSFSDNVEITAYASFNLGKAGTVFDSDQGKGGIIRVRVYF
ncbi:MAG: hypothetical protein ABIA75_14760 [Candidatus Neomarinimicrobiota bacterium]